MFLEPYFIVALHKKQPKIPSMWMDKINMALMVIHGHAQNSENYELLGVQVSSEDE